MLLLTGPLDMSSALMLFGEMTKTILLGNEGPFYSSTMDMVDLIPGSLLI